MAQKVRLLKNHLKWKTGDIAHVDDTQAHYWARCNVAEYVDDNPAHKEEVLLQHLEETNEVELATEESKPKRGRKPKQ